MTFFVVVFGGWAVAWTVLWAMEAIALVQCELALNRAILARVRGRR